MLVADRLTLPSIGLFLLHLDNAFLLALPMLLARGRFAGSLRPGLETTVGMTWG